MRPPLALFALCLGLLAGPAVAVPPAGVDIKKVKTHLVDHQAYPASRAELITSCFNLEDFSPVEKKWFISTLPNRKFTSADDVMAALSK